eukprot:TRINITY_DN9245_c0_g1_i1.p1 TRINITY_DN9245_c0_g1~~TRINITY_DN9245_c0_g1_i1.p1  ORF type:complete len:958 (+),score=480.13 TRINITY_DN9245_c0_g1_i1:42-2915(+)
MSAPTMYVVKGTPSADILQVCDPKEKDTTPLAECKRIGLGSVSVPKVGRMTQMEIIPDDPWGWEARDFARKAVIGKTIKFVKESYVEQLERDVGEVLYQKDGKVLSLAVELAKNGLAEVSERAGKSNSDLAGRIADAQIKAVEEKLGKYGVEKPRQSVNWEASREEVAVIGKEFRGKTIQAVVEAAMSGYFLKVCLVPQHIYLPLQLTGVICDRMNASDVRADSEKDKDLFAQMARDAKAFTERMLNNRDVQIVIDGHNEQNDMLLGSIVSGDAVFQELLLKNGLAKIFEPTLLKAVKNRTRLVDAEKGAKERRAGRWANLQVTQVVQGGKGGDAAAAKPAPAKRENFTGTLLQAQSPDTFFILDSKTGEEVKVNLANVRGGGDTNNEPPKRDEEGRPTGNTSNFARIERNDDLIVYKNFFLEGRDFVAKRLLDRELRVDVEFMAEIPLGRPVDGQEPEKEVRIQCSIYYKNLSGQWSNIATELIAAGLGVSTFAKEGNRAQDYFDYSDAFDQAKAAKKGIHGNRAKGDHKVQDILSGDKATGSYEKKGRTMLTYLQRSGSGTAGIPKLQAFVEYVLGPARIKLHIPRENCQISLNLAGLAAPNLARPGQGESDPYAQEALNFSKKQLLQREVEVQVEHFHKGTFVGNVWVKGQNVAMKLLEEGYATMEGQNTQSMVGRSAATETEQKAKAAKKGIWSDDGGLPKRVQEGIERFERRFAGRSGFQVVNGPRIPATMTEILDSTTFFFQPTSAKESLRKIESSLHGLNLDAKPTPEAGKIPHDQLIAAKFTDNKWYRAKLVKSLGPKVVVHFVDFGNKETVELSKIRIVSREVTLPDIAPLAQEAHLAFMHKLELDDLGGQAAAQAFDDFIEERAITVAHEYTSGRKKFYTVRAGEKPLQADLIKKGLGLVALDVAENREVGKAVGVLNKLEQAAKQGKQGMWRELRGDPRSYDDDRY